MKQAPPTSDDVDALLASWDDRLRRIDENLLALEAEPTYQMFAGAPTRPVGLEGVTKARVAAALDAVAQLFEAREKLTATVERARTLRASVSSLAFWDRDEKLAAVVALLRDASIDAGSESTPLAGRTLLGIASREVKVSPEDLVLSMAQSFETARDTFTSVSRAWHELEAELGAADARVAKLGAEIVRSAEQSDLASLEQVRGELAALRERVATDPLAVDTGLRAALAPRLESLAAAVAASDERRRRAEASVEAARRSLESLTDDLRRARETVAECGRLIEGAIVDDEPLDAAPLDDLSSWLAKLAATCRAGRFRSADVGLARWATAATEFGGRVRATGERAAALVSAHSELAGRLSARHAQADALAGRGLGLPAAADRAWRQADELLRRRPSPLLEARAAVDAYDAFFRTHGQARR